MVGPAVAGPVEFGPWFVLKPIFAGLIYLLYVLVPILGVWLWRRGKRGWAVGLAAAWVLCATAPLLDQQRARLQAEAQWDLRVMPDTLPIDGRVFVSDDTVRTPHTAIHRFNAPEAVYGLYNLDETRAAFLAGPVDLGDLRYFEHVAAPGRYKDRRTVETPAGTRVTPDYMMLARFHGEGRALLYALKHPRGIDWPEGFGAQFAIVTVDDPAAFDIRTAQMVMLVPYASESYYPAPFNPLVRKVYSAAPYSDQMALLIEYFCAGLDAETRDRCRRDI
ncbi:MAG: hypothetical protein AB3N17_06840 [Tateyamaria sp.]